jgi:hypothetical protein
MKTYIGGEGGGVETEIHAQLISVLDDGERPDLHICLFNIQVKGCWKLLLLSCWMVKQLTKKLWHLWVKMPIIHNKYIRFSSLFHYSMLTVVYIRNEGFNTVTE